MENEVKNLMDNWCEIFKIGKHKDSNGHEKDWTLEDLEKIKYNFENVNPDVPICCGHPKTNTPAYGWWDKLKIEGGKLFATFKQVQPEFEEACKKGLFKTRSISLTSDLVPRHLAFLGAQAPAIKGMEQFSFNENESDIKIEFAAENNQQITTDIGENMSNFEEENKDLKEKIEKLQKQLKDKEEEIKLKEFQDFCDKAIADGNLLPAQKGNVLNLFQSLEDKTFNFEDGTQKTSKETLTDFISSLKQFDFEEVASKKNVSNENNINFQDPKAIASAILTMQQEHKEKGINLSVTEAYRKLEDK